MQSEPKREKSEEDSNNLRAIGSYGREGGCFVWFRIIRVGREGKEREKERPQLRVSE